MNSYEQKLEARRERLEARAAAKRAEAQAAFRRSKQMSDVIPFGQPILVGHYSEGRDRRYRARMQSLMFKGCELDSYADELERRAASVGTGGISSDDPSAADKLREKIAEAEASQENMKAANKVIRKKVGDEQKVEQLVAMGYTSTMAWELLKPDFAGRVGFPSYRLQNNNANIRRMKQRLEELDAKADAEDVEQEYDGLTYREDTDLNRVQLIFDGKPSSDVRQILKARGFRWAPSVQAWQRQLNNAGKFNAERAIEELQEKGLI